MLGTNKIKKIHFIGVGGAGMSGIAEILINLNFLIKRTMKFGLLLKYLQMNPQSA